MSQMLQENAIIFTKVNCGLNKWKSFDSLLPVPSVLFPSVAKHTNWTG